MVVAGVNNEDRFYQEFLPDRTPLSAYLVERRSISFIVQFNNRNYGADYAKIENHTFTQDVFFEDLFLGEGIVFNNCNFQKKIIFSKVKSNLEKQKYNQTDFSVIFKSCEINSLAFYNINELFNGVHILGKRLQNLEIENVYIKKSNFLIEGVDLSSSIKADKLNFLDGNGFILKNIESLRADVEIQEFKGLITLEKCNLKKRLTFAGEFSALNFESSAFDDNCHVSFNPGSLLTFNNNNFNKSIQLDQNLPENTTEDVKKEEKVKDEKESSLIIGKNNFEDSFILNGNPDVPLKMVINSNKNLKGLFELSSCLLDLKLTGNNSNVGFAFLYCDFKKLYINHF